MKNTKINKILSKDLLNDHDMFVLYHVLAFDDPLKEEDLENLILKLNGNYKYPIWIEISKRQKLSEEFILKYKNNLYW